MISRIANIANMVRYFGIVGVLHIAFRGSSGAHYRLVDPITDSSGERLELASVWRPEEKGSDVNLGSRLLNDAWSDAFDVAAVLTNDSDFTAPIRLSVARNKTVLIIHPDNNPARSLTNSATGSLHLHDKHLRDSQLPSEITLANGKVVRKPVEF